MAHFVVVIITLDIPSFAEKVFGLSKYIQNTKPQEVCGWMSGVIGRLEERTGHLADHDINISDGFS